MQVTNASLRLLFEKKEVSGRDTEHTLILFNPFNYVESSNEHRATSLNGNAVTLSGLSISPFDLVPCGLGLLCFLPSGVISDCALMSPSSQFKKPVHVKC